MILWLLVVFCSLSTTTDTIDNSVGDAWYQQWGGGDDDDEPPPDALPPDAAPFLNLTVRAGAAADLACAFTDLADKTTVSWLRRHEGQLRLLSVGLDIYSRDPRYTFERSGDDCWRLTIAAVREADGGLYQCQLASHPPLAYARYLHVIVPEFGILDERGLRILTKFYNSGSTVELRCVVSRVPRPQHFVVWTHGRATVGHGRVLNFDTTRGGISVKTALLADGVRSSLFVANARPRDSGNYTCSLAGVGHATVAVHVLDGETPAAMQHGEGSRLDMWPGLLIASVAIPQILR